jgi:hypothetical protein
MNKKTYSQILNDVAHEQFPANLDLAPQIKAQIQQGKSVKMKLRMKRFLIVIVTVLVLAVMLVNVPAVYAALQRWFGYVPGVGLVREGQLRVLAEPVIVTREGITITVNQALLDTERTVLVYSVEGIPNDAISIPKPHELEKECLDGNDSLRLPDGTVLSTSRGGGEDSWGTGYRVRSDYPAIQVGVNNVDLVIPCLLHTRRGAAPENWEIPLHFVPAPPGLTAFPVIDIPTPTVPVATVAPQASPVSNINDITLTLDRAVQMDDGYLIYASMHWQGADLNSIDLVQPEITVHLLDASGHEMIHESIDDENTGMKFEEHRTVFALKTAPIHVNGPLTIVVDSVSATLLDQAQATFTFDPGPNPKPEQTWQMDQHVQIGKYSLQVLSAWADPEVSSGYSFEMKSDSGVLDASLSDMEHPVIGGGGGGGGLSGVFSGGFTYAEKGLPAGPLTIGVSNIAVRRNGPWQAQWTPSAASPQAIPTHPAACLNAPSWKEALKQNSKLPAGVSGRLLNYAPADDSSKEWTISLSNLDGSGKQVVPDARDGSLSPDGSKLAYSSDNAIYVTDLTSNQTTRLPGTSEGDINPLWSPDGSQIVFMRGMGIYDLFIVNADGSNLRRLTNGGLQEWPLSWMSDGQHLLYSVPGRENEYTNYQVNVSTGESQIFSNENILSISPDGKYKITEEKVFGDRWILYISDIDGSNRWALADSDLWVSSPAWSPEAKWLLVSIADKNPSSTIGALINLQDCQIIPLPYFKGNIISWGP